MPQQSFEVDNHGQAIRGTFYRPDITSRVPVVVLLHGFTGQRIESGFLFVQLARALNKRNVAAVTFDFRNSGESDGSFDQMLVTQELDDALRMTQWSRSQAQVDRTRMGLLGFSLGGLLASCCMSRTNVYRALCLVAPTTVTNLCRHAGEKPAGEPIYVGPHRLHQRFFDDVRTLNPVADVIVNPRPTLLIQGAEDTAVPPDVSQAYVDELQRSNVPVRHDLISDANHVFSTPAARERLVDTVVDWFAEAL